MRRPSKSRAPINAKAGPVWRELETSGDMRKELTEAKERITILKDSLKLSKAVINEQSREITRLNLFIRDLNCRTRPESVRGFNAN